MTLKFLSFPTEIVQKTIRLLRVRIEGYKVGAGKRKGRDRAEALFVRTETTISSSEALAAPPLPP